MTLRQGTWVCLPVATSAGPSHPPTLFPPALAPPIPFWLLPPSLAQRSTKWSWGLFCLISLCCTLTNKKACFTVYHWWGPWWDQHSVRAPYYIPLGPSFPMLMQGTLLVWSWCTKNGWKTKARLSVLWSWWLLLCHGFGMFHFWSSFWGLWLHILNKAAVSVVIALTCPCRLPDFLLKIFFQL